MLGPAGRAAAHAAKAAGLSAPERTQAIGDEITWQLERMSPEVRAALRTLPRIGEHRSGPLGPGLLSSGLMGVFIGELQACLIEPGRALPMQWPGA